MRKCGRGVRAPRVDNRRLRILTGAEIEKMLTFAPDSWHAAWTDYALSGERGELPHEGISHLLEPHICHNAVSNFKKLKAQRVLAFRILLDVSLFLEGLKQTEDLALVQLQSSGDTRNPQRMSLRQELQNIQSVTNGRGQLQNVHPFPIRP